MVRNFGRFWTRLAVCCFLVWIVVLFYVFWPLIQVRGGGGSGGPAADDAAAAAAGEGDDDDEVRKLRAKVSELEDLLANREWVISGLRRRLKVVKGLFGNGDTGNDDDDDEAHLSQRRPIPPPDGYEEAKRAVRTHLTELWNYLRSQLGSIRRSAASAASTTSTSGPSLASLMTELSIAANRTFDAAKHRCFELDARLDDLEAKDGYLEWRLKEAEDLRAEVGRRIDALQNPPGCSSSSGAVAEVSGDGDAGKGKAVVARKLLCDLDKHCGYGCQVHHAVYCFIVAYGTERTLILKAKNWKYNRSGGGFTCIFQPLSRTCPEAADSSAPADPASPWPGNAGGLFSSPDSNSSKDKVISLPPVDYVSPRPAFIPPAIPADLAPRLLRLHGDPVVWWVGEFLRYLLRPQPEMADYLASVLSKSRQEALQQVHLLDPSGSADLPMVGIHVRRTDKIGTEAAFHPVSEYMAYVVEYFQKLEVKRGKPLEVKAVYVASDDPGVLAECRRSFPGIYFLGDASIAQLAALSSRYSKGSLRGIMVDVHMLAQSDYLVCTFSSQVCRLAYEVMQQRFVDASDRFKSLDDSYYFGGQSEHIQVAIAPHKASGPEEIDIEVGDELGLAGNHWDGYSKGRNHRTNRIGLYPAYKVKDKPLVVEFPNYQQQQQQQQKQQQ